MAIYFVRHGETECNVKQVYYGSLDVAVTDRGIAQAEAVGEMLKDVVFDRVITSGLRRTQETADALLSRQNKSHLLPEDRQICTALNEMDFGAWEGLHPKQVEVLYPEDYRAMASDWFRCPPTGGEIFADFRQRVLEGWRELRISDEENILFVGHGGPIQCIICELLGMAADGIWHLEIRQGCYTKFELCRGFPVLRGMNLERREIFGKAIG